MELVSSEYQVGRVVVFGEGMIELSRSPDGGWRLGHGGDTLNTAIHLCRAGLPVAYLTALGADPFSAELRDGWEREGLDCSLIATHPTRQAGLYAITTDAAGERSFTYWRDASAARVMFDVPGADVAMAAARQARLLCFSLISLAILSREGRLKALDLASQVRGNGGQVAFDGNYRPRLWENRAEAIRWRDAAIAVSDIGLPTFEDEAVLCDAADPQEIAAHWERLGCGEVVVKLGAEGCRLPDGRTCPPPARLDPVDTSGAGDAFNGGYLAARIMGRTVDQAALHGHALAGWTVMRRGAIPPRDAAAPY